MKKLSLIILTLLLVVLFSASSEKCGYWGNEFLLLPKLMSGILGCKDAKMADKTDSQVERTDKPGSGSDHNAESKDKDQTAVKVTFIELGSVNCIPCRMMKKVMDQVEEKYGPQVNIIFYDVWTPAGKPYAMQYRIRSIPTQVFLDKDGSEYFRHAGFFPFNELEKVLKQQGIR